MSRYFLSLGVRKNVLAAAEVYDNGSSYVIYSAFKKEVNYEATEKGWVNYYLADDSTVEVNKNEFIRYSNSLRTTKNTYDNHVNYEGKV